MNETLNSIRSTLAPLSERGEGSTNNELIQACVDLHRLPPITLDDPVSQQEKSLRRSVCMLLTDEVAHLKSAESYGDELTAYIELSKWVVRLGRVITSRKVRA